MVTIIKNYY